MTEQEKLRKKWDDDKRYITALCLATGFFISHEIPYSEYDMSELINKSADAAELLAIILVDKSSEIIANQ